MSQPLVAAKIGARSCAGGGNLKKSHTIRVWLLAGVAGAMLGTAATPTPTLAQTDPGVRGGPAGAGGPLPNLIPGGGSQPSSPGFFQAAKVFFVSVFSVTGSINDAGQGATDGGPGLGPRYNFNSCTGCHAQPAAGGTSPKVNPQVAVATLHGARNVVPPFITLDGPVREARFVRNPDGTPDGQVHELYVTSGRPDAPGCNIQQENFPAALAANNVIFRIPTPTFGLGLVEGISDLGLTTAFNSHGALKSQLGISGRFNTSPNDGTITRFGWKAQNKSLLMFSGEALADGITQGNANGQEFRTAPLWGVGQRIFFLHDGRTGDLREAILAHASPQSEANAVINNFNLLPPQSKQNLLNF
jgi:CxxC motif-containing protein (DUF1111 family)